MFFFRVQGQEQRDNESRRAPNLLLLKTSRTLTTLVSDSSVNIEVFPHSNQMCEWEWGRGGEVPWQ